MRIGDLVTSRLHDVMGIVIDIGNHHGELWANVHWLGYSSVDNIQYADDLEVIC